MKFISILCKVLLFCVTASISLNAFAQEMPRGEWALDAAVDPITDFESQTALNMSIDAEAILGATCINDVTRLNLMFASAIGEPNNTRKRVLFRFDKEPAQEKIMIVSNNSRITSFDDNSESIPTLKKMADHETLIVRISPDRGRTITATFNIAGFGEHMDKIRGACGW